jgi:hypothetical protein
LTKGINASEKIKLTQENLKLGHGGRRQQELLRFFPQIFLLLIRPAPSGSRAAGQP